MDGANCTITPGFSAVLYGPGDGFYLIFKEEQKINLAKREKIKSCANLNNFNYIFDFKMGGSSYIAPKCDLGYDSNK